MIIPMVKTSGIDEIIILGDLNADPVPTMVLNTLHINEPTRITDNTSTCLDQIITNMPNFVRNTNVPGPLANCDHCLVSANL